MHEEKRVQLMKVEEVAAALRVPKSWVYLKAERGQIPCIRVGRYLRFDLREVIASFAVAA